MKRYLILFVFLFVISGCQDEENIPVSSATDNQQQLEKKTKVVVCHKTGNGAYIPLEISVNALPAHLAHGDYLPDADNDGYTAIGSCTGSMNDCNDQDSTIHPNVTELCDNIDNNCDGQIDEGLPTNIYYLDNDQDGYGDPNISLTKCSQPAGYVVLNGDCNDNNADIHPGAAEICDGIDNNCNGLMDEGLPFEMYFADNDNDGYGNPSITLIKCLQPSGYVTNGDDCDDNNSAVNPNAVEVCGDNIDNDCDGEIDEGCGPQSCPGIPTVDYGGKIYNTVQIGTQCWLKENLNVGTRINGNQNQTNNSTIEKYCYGDNVSNCNTYGGLYQWNEAMQYVTTAGAQGICPTGWHIPTKAEFQTLQNMVGNNSNALLKQGQGIGTNGSGFSGLLSGFRHQNGSYIVLGQRGYYYSSTICPGCWSGQNSSWVMMLFADGGILNLDFLLQSAHSIRCIKN